MRASSSPAPCGPKGPRADGGGPGWGWPKMLAVIGDSGSLGRYGAHAARPGAGRRSAVAVVGTGAATPSQPSPIKAQTFGLQGEGIQGQAILSSPPPAS